MKRNQPCNCGSGKKYKHCCLNIDNQYQRMIEIVEEFEGPCFLCNAPDPEYFALFIPEGEAAEALNVPSNKQRHILYSLCSDCFALPNKSELVERQIFEIAASGAPIPHFNFGKEPIYD